MGLNGSLKKSGQRKVWSEMILKKILKEKRQIVSDKKKTVPFEELTGRVNRKPLSLKKNLERNRFGIVAEIKRASPSAGIIDKQLDVKSTALTYLEMGVSGISVLTCEPFFYGSVDDIKSVRETVDLPLLMKDFIFDPYQIYLGKAYGADAVLLIIKILSDRDFLELLNTADRLMMDTLIEVHTEEEAGRVLDLVKNWENKILGINNRNLETLKTDIDVTLSLIKFLLRYKITTISESGIRCREDVERLKNAGLNGVLIGESILKSRNIAKKIKELM